MKSICIVTTMWSSINNWIKPFLNEYNENDIKVTIVCNMDESYEAELKEQFPFVNTYPIAFPRGISVMGSVKSVLALKKFLKKNSFDLIQYSTPNASIYASLASKMAKVPVRLYCQWGMVYVTMHGIKRKIFKMLEKMVCRFSTNIQPDSVGNLEFCRKEGFYNEAKSEVIWCGSAKGLDLTAFDVTKKEAYSREIRQKYDIPADAPVVGFVGRLGREKGCHELFDAFKTLKKGFPAAKLLFVGPIEKEETMTPEMLEYFKTCDDIIKTDRVTNVERFISAMDVFVLPSYREGFGMSVVEAAAMEVPVIVTKYPGPSSAMIDGVNGYTVDVGNADSIVDKVSYLLNNPKKAAELGKNGRKYVEESYDQRVFKQKYMENRLKLLRQAEEKK